MALVKLLDNVSEDTISGMIQGRGGIAKVFVNGDNFGSGTVKLQASPEPGTAAEWYDDTNLNFTAKGYKAVQFKEGVNYRLNFSGSSGASNVRGWVAYENKSDLPL